MYIIGIHMESAIYPAGGKKTPQVQICNISGRMQKKPPRCRYVIYPAGPTLLVYTWNLPYIRPEAKKPPQVQICNISGRMQKKPRMQKKKNPRCRYVMYPAGPTLLVYTWNLPYIRPEAKKNPRCRYVIYPAEPAFFILKINQWPNPILQQYYHLWYTNGTQSSAGMLFIRPDLHF
jgi:hypothetical protein